MSIPLYRISQISSVWNALASDNRKYITRIYKERFFIMAPVVPPMSAIGRNTATVVSVEAIIAMETSFAPISADSAAV